MTRRKRPRSWTNRLALALLAGGTSLCAAALALLVADARVAARPPRPDGPVFAAENGVYEAARPGMVAQRFSAEKAPGALRVFVLGGSQAMGSPYVTQQNSRVSLARLLPMPNEGGVSTWLRQYLSALYPGRSVEVINAAEGGADARAVASILREVMAVGRPDLLIVDVGDNERNVPGVRDMRLRAGGLEPAMERLTSEFAAAAAEMARLAGGTPVYFLTVADNLRDWLPEGPAAFDFARALGRIESGEAARVLEELSAGNDGADPLRLFAMARCQDALGRADAARALYVAAKDRDRAFLRCRSAWNRVVRGLRGDNVRVLDAERLMAGHARDGIPGRDLFFDYCHFTIRGNKLLAREIARRIALDDGLGEAAAARLDAARLEDPAARDLRLLYAFKIAKWAKASYYSRRRDIRSLNADQVRENYRRAKEELDWADEQLRLRRAI